MTSVKPTLEIQSIIGDAVLSLRCAHIVQLKTHCLRRDRDSYMRVQALLIREVSDKIRVEKGRD